MLPKRHGASSDYRYGYQGSEKDDEVKGEGNSYTTHYRLLDPRVGRWLTRDPKFTAFESPYASMGNNPILFNDKAGDTIRNARIADYQNKTPKYHHSRPGFDVLTKGGDSEEKDTWTITPYFDKNDKVVAYAAGRLSLGNEYAIEYYLDKGDYAPFMRNIDNYTMAADLFMMNGPPSDADLAFMSGLQNKSFSEVLSGLKKQWGEALSDPVWIATTLIMLGDGAIRPLKPTLKVKKTLPKPGKGKGSVAPELRDPKRVFTNKQRSEMLESQGGTCAGCEQTKTVNEIHGHHLQRHADGGKTTMENAAALCKECHIEIHK